MRQRRRPRIRNALHQILHSMQKLERDLARQVQQPPSTQEGGVQAIHARQLQSTHHQGRGRAMRDKCASTEAFGDLKLLLQSRHPHCSSASSSSSSPPISPAVFLYSAIAL